MFQRTSRQVRHRLPGGVRSCGFRVGPEGLWGHRGEMVKWNWVVKGGLAREMALELSFKGALAEQRARGSEESYSERMLNERSGS